MSKKIMSMLVVVVMFATMLAGCGNSNVENGNKEGSETDSTVENESVSTKDSVELKMCMYSFGLNVTDSEKVVTAINEYIEPKIGATINVEWISFGDWNNQINLKLSGGEQMDVLPVFGTVISTLYGKDGLTALDELIDTYGSGIKSVVGDEYLKAGYINGSLYTIPSVQTWAKDMCLQYRLDIAEKYNLDFSNVKTLEDLEPIFEIVLENEPDMYCLISPNQVDPMLKAFGWDTLGDEYGVLMNPTESLEVTNLFETSEYEEMVNLMNDWYQKGYVQTDAATSADDVPTIFGTGKAFGVFQKIEPGTLEMSMTNLGYETGAIEIASPLSTTSTVNNACWGIPTTSASPEKAMQFLELLYTDPVVANLLIYGIEGEHYQIIDADNDVASFTEGQDFESTTYFTSIANVGGNKTIAHLWDSDPVTLKEDLKKINENAAISKALGFNFDSAAVANELTALDTVTAKYRRGLECGSLDASTELPNFIQELKAAGIDKVIEEKQSQLDAWVNE